MRKGTILILVLAVLVLLSLLATVSASLQALARLESIRYMEVLESRWVAKLGFERVVAELARDPIGMRREVAKGGRDKPEKEYIEWEGRYYGRENPPVGSSQETVDRQDVIDLDGDGLEFRDSGFSRTEDRKNGRVYFEVTGSDPIRYKVTFNIDGAVPGATVLLATPVFDDVTIFYSEGIKIISYVEQTL